MHYKQWTNNHRALADQLFFNEEIIIISVYFWLQTSGEIVAYVKPDSLSRVWPSLVQKDTSLPPPSGIFVGLTPLMLPGNLVTQMIFTNIRAQNISSLYYRGELHIDIMA